MDEITGRLDQIEDVLVHLHRGQWFKWSDPANKIYENLVILDSSKEKPTKAFLESELKKKQGEFDASVYQGQRRKEYPALGDQLDYIFHHGVAKWKTDIVQPVKDKYPKP